MHQLTKDPEWVQPRRGDRLSLTGKVAALYAQDLEDGLVLAAVAEVEDLTAGLSRSARS